MPAEGEVCNESSSCSSRIEQRDHPCCWLQDAGGGEEINVDPTVPFKKRFKIASSGSCQNMKKLQFDDITLSLSKKLASHQAFPQEEKDAAIVLANGSIRWPQLHCMRVL